MLIVCDLDGTLCDSTHREHLIQSSWEEFHEACVGDKPIPQTHWFLQMVTGWGEGLDRDSLIFLTGRNEAHRAATVNWLFEQCAFSEGDDYEALLMRPENDYSKDVDLKPSMLEAWLAGCEPNVYAKEDILILEDRDKVVVNWRNLGYTCWQVREGTY